MLLSTKQAAARLGVHPHTVRGWIINGSIAAHKMGNRASGRNYISERETERLLAAGGPSALARAGAQKGVK